MEYDGTLLLNQKIRIYPGYTEEDFKKSSMYNAEKYNRNLSRSMYLVLDGEYLIDNMPFMVGFIFKGGFLKQVFLLCVDKSVAQIGEWLFDEKRRKQLHDEFVERRTNKPEHAWGKIESIMSPRDQVSLIIARRNN